MSGDRTVLEAAAFARRFWSNVKVGAPELCWEWGLSRFVKRGGYGQIRTSDKRTLKTHRVAYELHYGTIPPGMFVCHRCSNPPCCNPHHLYAGTPADNSADTVAAGHQYIPPLKLGERVASAKLKEADVREIFGSREGAVALSRKFGVSRQIIWRIKTGKAWKCVLTTL